MDAPNSCLDQEAEQQVTGDVATGPVSREQEANARSSFTVRSGRPAGVAGQARGCWRRPVVGVGMWIVCGDVDQEPRTGIGRR